MKNKKVLWLVLGAVVLVAAAVILCVVCFGNSGKTPETSEVSRPAVTFRINEKATATGTQNGQKTSADNTNETATNTASDETKITSNPRANTSEKELRSMGIGGGEFYYAIGYKPGDNATKNLVASAIQMMDKKQSLRLYGQRWFSGQVYPRDERRSVSITVDDVLLKSYIKNGITVGVIDGNAPVASFDENGQAVGYEIDVATASFATYDITPKFVPVTMENAAEKLNNGEVNLIWGGLRDGAVNGLLYSDINEWNLENEMSYYTPKGTRYKGETDLLDTEGKMGVVKDTLCARFVIDRLNSAGYVDKIIEYATTKEAFSALESGEVYVVACDYLSVYAMWKQS